MRACLPFLFAATLAAASCASQSAPPVILHVVRDAEACHIELDGRAITDDALLVAARAWRGRTVRIESDINTPYKCIGIAIYTVQRAGVKKVGWELSPKK